MDGQKTLQLNTLYKASKEAGVNNINDQLKPNLFVNSGTVDIYGSGSLTQPATLSEMTVNYGSKGVSGSTSFNMIPTWIAITQKTGATTEIVSNGLFVKDMGVIA